MLDLNKLKEKIKENLNELKEEDFKLWYDDAVKSIYGDVKNTPQEEIDELNDFIGNI